MENLYYFIIIESPQIWVLTVNYSATDRVRLFAEKYMLTTQLNVNWFSLVKFSTKVYFMYIYGKHNIIIIMFLYKCPFDTVQCTEPVEKLWSIMQLWEQILNYITSNVIVRVEFPEHLRNKQIPHIFTSGCSSWCYKLCVRSLVLCIRLNENSCEQQIWVKIVISTKRHCTWPMFSV